jgi:hypothetical protein
MKTSIYNKLINTSTIRAEQKIKVPVQCYGITFIDNDIVLGNRGVRYSDIFNLHIEIKT